MKHVSKVQRKQRRNKVTQAKLALLRRPRTTTDINEYRQQPYQRPKAA